MDERHSSNPPNAPLIRLLLIGGALAMAAGGVGLWWLSTRKAAPKATADGEANTGAEADASSTHAEFDPETVDIPPGEVLDRAREFYDSRPYFQQPVPYTEVPEGLSDLRAETCGSCHEAIYEEWRISTHRRAWTQDAQFQAELAKSRGVHKDSPKDSNSPDDVGWMCVTCHTPVVNQLERVVVGLEDGDIGQPKYAKNPAYDPKMQDDAITCATCHVRDGVVYGPYGDTDAPHPTAKDPKLREPSTCTDCHQANAHWPSRNLACFFSTGEEYRNSPYPEEGKTCQSCHMPKVERKLAAAYDRPKRTTRRHWFGGSLIPKHPKYTDQMKRLEPVYGSGAEIELLHRERASKLNTSEHGRLTVSDCPKDVETCKTYVVRVTNAHAGHNLPTGDPERHIDIEATARNADGDTVARAEQRIASKYKWWPEIELQYDNRIPPRKYLDFLLHVPADTRPVTVTIEAHKYRMYTGAFEHHDLKGEYVRGRRFHQSRWRVDGKAAPERVRLIDDKHPTDK